MTSAGTITRVSINNAPLSGLEFAHLNGSKYVKHFRYRNPDIEEYQAEKHLQIITTVFNPSVLPKSDALFTPPALISSESSNRCWEYFFKPRLQKIILCNSDNAAAWFPGHTVPAAGSEEKGQHYRGTLFYERYLDLLTFDGGLPGVINGKTNDVRIATLEHNQSNWPWLFIDKPALFSVLPESDEVSPTNADAQYLAKHLLSLISQSTPSIEPALQLVHQSWTAANAQYSPPALEAVEQVVRQVKERISENAILPLMFELEAMVSMLSCFSKLDIFASGIFAGNWVEVAAVPVQTCRGSELCNEDRLLQELLKLPKHHFAPLVVNEYRSVSDGNHRLTSVWIWNLLKACADCNWDLDDLQFQRRVAGYLSAQEIALHSVSVYEALQHLAAFLKKPDKRRILLEEIACNVRQFNEIETLPVVLLPEYLSSAVIKDLYDGAGTKIRIQPHIYEFLAREPNAVLPARGSYHFADCAPLPWFKVLS